MIKWLTKTFSIYTSIWLILSGPLVTLVQAQEISPTPTPESTPTPTLSYRERSRLQTQELINSYYERYGITPRPKKSSTEPTPTETPADLANTQDTAENLITPTTTVTPSSFPSLPPAISPSPTPLPEDGEPSNIEEEGYSGNDPLANNSNTGSDSTNEADASETTETIVENENTTTYEDTFYETADTGFNTASSITGELDLTSGDANLTFSETNQFNCNYSRLLTRSK